MARRAVPSPDHHGFKAIDPWKTDEHRLRRRSLPHLEAQGATYFVTFGALWRKPLPDKALDKVFEVILPCDRKTIELDAAVVMPNHVHLIFRLASQRDLSQVLKHIKGASARRINQVLKRTGSVWMNESFDRVVRDARDFENKIEYVTQNPVKRCLVCDPGDYKWLFLKSAE